MRRGCWILDYYGARVSQSLTCGFDSRHFILVFDSVVVGLPGWFSSSPVVNCYLLFSVIEGGRRRVSRDKEDGKCIQVQRGGKSNWLGALSIKSLHLGAFALVPP